MPSSLAGDFEARGSSRPCFVRKLGLGESVLKSVAVRAKKVRGRLVFDMGAFHHA